MDIDTIYKENFSPEQLLFVFCPLFPVLFMAGFELTRQPKELQLAS